MRTTYPFLLLLFTFSHTLLARQESSDILIGQRYTLQSEYYPQGRTLKVALPDNYDANGKPYPVLYLLDGQRWFLEAVSQRQVLTHYSYTPDFIIVGIDTEDQPRFRFFNQSQPLQDHLEKEVIPFIENKFHTSEQRMLFGWQFAAAFTIQTLTDRPGLFSSWLAASPIPIEGSKVAALSGSIEEGRITDGNLTFATSRNENSVEDGARELAQMLEEKAPASFEWKYVKLLHEELAGAGHLTTPIGTIYQGLRATFQNYPVLEFNTTDDYKALGGFDYVRQYYQQRAESYGLSAEIPQEGMFFLVRMCLDSEDYPTFDFMMTQFEKTNFLNEINLGWNTRYAEFYLKNQQAEKAIGLYKKLEIRFQEDPRPVHGLGKAYEQIGQRATAISYYQKTVDLAKAQGDGRLARYEQDLERLRNQ